jgi:hypothetical protein
MKIRSSSTTAEIARNPGRELDSIDHVRLQAGNRCAAILHIFALTFRA